jgi:signal transduction histidine kinase
MKQNRIFKISLQTKIGIYFILFALLIINSIGWLLYYQSTTYFDEELGDNLKSIAKSASDFVDTELLSYIEPGSEHGKFYKSLSEPLRILQKSFGLKRVYIVDKNFKLLLDSNPTGKVGDNIPHLESNLAELQLTEKGKAIYSTLYRAYDGNLYKSAFAPVKDISGNITAIACVDASPSYLNVINKIEDFVILLNLISLIAAVLLSLLLARTIVNPIKELATAAQRVSKGSYTVPVKIKSKDELGLLGDVFNLMQNNIHENEQRLRALSAAVAHEIRNPLNSISLYLGLLRRKINNYPVNISSIDKIQKEIETLNDIVEDFLSFSRRSELNVSQFTASELIEESLFLAKDKIIEKQIKVNIEINPNKLILKGDKAQLKQALLNLIINAVQAMSSGGLLEIKVLKKEKITIQVIDNGQGIKKEFIDKIFEPFFSQRSNGTGLGLAIVSNIINSHKGTIFVNSVINKGTKITIQLPFK